MTILRASFWRTVWIAIRRSGKDKRSRALVIRTVARVVLLGYAVAAIWLVVVNDTESAILVAVIGVASVIAFLWARWIMPSDDSAGGFIAQGLRDYLDQRALILATLLTRAGSEVYLSQNEMPRGKQVITRQTQNEILRKNNLWEKLEPDEVELMSSPDGSWTDQQRILSRAWCEQLRLLRWTLGIDAEIAPLMLMPVLDFNVARGLLESGQPLGKPQTLETWTLRKERDTAHAYLARLVAEMHSRGLAQPADSDGWSANFREQLVGASKDLLVGAKTVAELDDQTVTVLCATAWARYQYAAYLVELLSNAQAFPFAKWMVAMSSQPQA